jgi:hypothetical protein
MRRYVPLFYKNIFYSNHKQQIREGDQIKYGIPNYT